VRLLYTHGLGGSPRAQPEIDEVLAPPGYTVTRVAVPYHGSAPELIAKLATSTFGDLCRWVDEGADNLIAAARQFSPEPYAVVGDSLGGFISVVAAERDPRISHCILLACSGDFCDAMMRLHALNPVLGTIAGKMAEVGNVGIEVQAHRAISGHSDFQHDFDLINTFVPERLARLKRLLILGDKRDPVAPERACLHFARGIADATVRIVYDEGRDHPIGRDALQRYAVPFLQNRPVPEVLPSSAKVQPADERSSIKAVVRRVLRRLRPPRPPETGS
jgi:pimeloyl-ACP methyl ester carboxylesterase